MGLSNYVPNSRISQAGVCTSTTRPATPYEGQVIYETDTNRVLVWDASAWVAPNSDTSNAPGLELIRHTTFSGTTSIPMDNTLSSDYDVYRIVLFITNVASGGLYFRLRNGSSDIAGNAYYTAGYSVSYNAPLAAVQQGGATYYAPMTGNLYDGPSLSMDLFYINNGAIPSWNSHGQTRGNAVTYATAGGYHAAVSHDGFRFYTDVAATGEIYLYGYRK